MSMSMIDYKREMSVSDYQDLLEIPDDEMIMYKLRYGDTLTLGMLYELEKERRLTNWELGI